MPARAGKEVFRKAFGELIKELRIEAGLTQEQLSFRTDVHRTYVGDIERGLKSPTLEVIIALATALGAEPGLLVDTAFRRGGRKTSQSRPPAPRRQRVRRSVKRPKPV